MKETRFFHPSSLIPPNTGLVMTHMVDSAASTESESDISSPRAEYLRRLASCAGAGGRDSEPSGGGRGAAPTARLTRGICPLGGGTAFGSRFGHARGLGCCLAGTSPGLDPNRRRHVSLRHRVDTRRLV